MQGWAFGQIPGQAAEAAACVPPHASGRICKRMHREFCPYAKYSWTQILTNNASERLSITTSSISSFESIETMIDVIEWQ